MKMPASIVLSRATGKEDIRAFHFWDRCHFHFFESDCGNRRDFAPIIQISNASNPAKLIVIWIGGALSLVELKGKLLKTIMGIATHESAYSPMNFCKMIWQAVFLRLVFRHNRRLILHQ